MYGRRDAVTATASGHAAACGPRAPSPRRPAVSAGSAGPRGGLLRVVPLERGGQVQHLGRGAQMHQLQPTCAATAMRANVLRLVSAASYLVSLPRTPHWPWPPGVVVGHFDGLGRGAEPSDRVFLDPGEELCLRDADRLGVLLGRCLSGMKKPPGPRRDTRPVVRRAVRMPQAGFTFGARRSWRPASARTR
jgi:hypothetical protein